MRKTPATIFTNKYIENNINFAKNMRTNICVTFERLLKWYKKCSIKTFEVVIDQNGIYFTIVQWGQFSEVEIKIYLSPSRFKIALENWLIVLNLLSYSAGQIPVHTWKISKHDPSRNIFLTLQPNTSQKCWLNWLNRLNCVRNKNGAGFWGAWFFYRELVVCDSFLHLITRYFIFHQNIEEFVRF